MLHGCSVVAGIDGSGSFLFVNSTQQYRAAFADVFYGGSADWGRSVMEDIGGAFYAGRASIDTKYKAHLGTHILETAYAFSMTPVSTDVNRSFSCFRNLSDWLACCGELLALPSGRLTNKNTLSFPRKRESRGEETGGKNSEGTKQETPHIAMESPQQLYDSSATAYALRPTADVLFLICHFPSALL